MPAPLLPMQAQELLSREVEAREPEQVTQELKSRAEKVSKLTASFSALSAQSGPPPPSSSSHVQGYYQQLGNTHRRVDPGLQDFSKIAEGRGDVFRCGRCAVLSGIHVYDP